MQNGLETQHRLLTGAPASPGDPVGPAGPGSPLSPAGPPSPRCPWIPGRPCQTKNQIKLLLSSRKESPLLDKDLLGMQRKYQYQILRKYQIKRIIQYYYKETTG